MLLFANILTGLRLAIAIALPFVMVKEVWNLALALTIVGLLSDAADGEVARASKKVPSEKRKKFGVHFDGTADALFALGLIIGLGVQGLLPWWVGFVMVAVVIAMNWIEKIPEGSPWWKIRWVMHSLHPLGSIIFLAYAVFIMTWQMTAGQPELRGALYVLYALCAILLAYVKRQRIRDKVAGA